MHPLVALLAAAPAALAAGGILAAAGLIGHALIPRWLQPARAHVALAVAISAGSTSLGWIVWLAGTCVGTTFAVWVGGLVVLAAAVRARSYGSLLWRASRHLWRVGLAAWPVSLVIVVALTPLLLMLLVPLVDADGLRYHAALPKIFLLTGKVFYYPYDVTGAFPQVAEMLTMLGLVVAGGPAAKILHFLFFLATLATLAWTVHRDRSTRVAGVLAALLFVASPVAYVPAAHAFTDHTALFHIAVALLLVTRRSHPLLVGVALAGAVVTKLTVVPVVGVLALAAVVRAGRRAWQRALVSVIAPPLLAFAPFAVRNVLATGDPVFPLGHGLIGQAVPGVSPEALRYATFYHGDIKTPLGIAWGPGLSAAPADEWAGWHHLLGLFAVIVAARYRPARLLLLPIVAFLPVSMMFRPPTRYFLPLLLALAALEALAITRVWRQRLAVVGVLAALPGVVLSADIVMRSFRPGDVVFGRVDRDTYLARMVDGYQAAKFASQAAGDGMIMALGLAAPYYLERPWIAEGILNEPPLRAAAASAGSAEELVAWLQQLRVRVLVVGPKYGGGRPESLVAAGVDRRSAQVLRDLRSRLSLLTSVDGFDVYAVGAPESAPPAPVAQ